MSNVQVRRIYEDVRDDDGRRVLVDRVWPRGVRKVDVALDDHVRDVAPSRELRQWYGHDPERFEEFRRRYLAELDEEEAADALRDLVEHAKNDRLTLLTATRNVAHSHAQVLAQRIREWLEAREGL